MKADVITLEENDEVIVKQFIGSMPPKDVDGYAKKILPKLISIFGKGRVTYLPVRDEMDWDLTIVKKPVKKK